jgi:two-component system chemotaxis response regulator CheB
MRIIGPKGRADRVVNGERIKRDVIVMGASAGGVEVLIRVFSEIPPDLTAVFAVVLHRGPVPSELLQVLGRRSTFPIVEPSHDVRLRTGVILLAPPDHHMELQDSRILVRRGPKEHSTRPAVDPLFRSAALSFDARVVGLLLSGCGDDGVNGLVSIKNHGGISLVQDPADSDMPSMPMNAIRYDSVDAILPIKTIAATLTRLARGVAVEW